MTTKKNHRKRERRRENSIKLGEWFSRRRPADSDSDSDSEATDLVVPTALNATKE